MRQPVRRPIVAGRQNPAIKNHYGADQPPVARHRLGRGVGRVARVVAQGGQEPFFERAALRQEVARRLRLLRRVARVVVRRIVPDRQRQMQRVAIDREAQERRALEDDEATDQRGCRRGRSRSEDGA